METRPEHGIDELIAELAQARKRVEAIYSKLGHARDTTLPRIGRTDDSALIVAGYLETYYTALETFFVRVSGYFENDLPQGRWHAILLEKMNLEIEEIRTKVGGTAIAFASASCSVFTTSVATTSRWSTTGLASTSCLRPWTMPIRQC